MGLSASIFPLFHLLRPWWLLALLPATIVWWRIFRHTNSRCAWQQWIDPLLLDALLVHGEQRRRLRPVHLLGVFWLLSIVALAGPTWERELSPLAEDKAALVIAFKVAPSMQETDIAPSRLQRAAEKISDLLSQRAGARNALIAYAGSAHLVVPLTSDANVIIPFVAELRPDLMPQPGDDPAAALTVAHQQFKKPGQSGAILFITDDWSDSAVAALAEYRQHGGVPVHVWAALADEPEFSTNEPTLTALKRAAHTGGGSFAVITPDPSDVDMLARSIQQTAIVAVGRAGEYWRDAGYWFVPVLVVIGGLWFRRGWVVVAE